MFCQIAIHPTVDIVNSCNHISAVGLRQRREWQICVATAPAVHTGLGPVTVSSLSTDIYESATRSNQPGNLLRQVLTACALAKVDDSGYFTPVAVKEPLSAILGRHVEIANFQNHLKAFIDPKRRAILQRDGEARAYRFRFKQPAMQPFVLMKGFIDGIIDIDAKRALSSPEEPDLFAT